ncbi:MAG: BlaI/MecI/CopY family transcriptional regulator [Fermentimonas sp.]|nr:BlaI/MecI/CopY family transcriptional regulator [Fermentimonas sp.]HBT84864.1 transcriptional regulator [Porphyromonadaceae bacterium]MDD2930310.1 BlaI/MecI/CopY family transcriptional regulator [Fermentimonas sp.]MDD3189554.1 BlaI/MecI/CopY family transcriptional regulator [Fermentimonas sp.]MDD3510897.1 BlaI/MecI/CopY family transcriptional regulator [Fermentimonas sp.]
MNELTAKEEEVMQYFWENGPMFVKQLVEKYPDPKPHFNTLSTYVRSLEEKGYLSHNVFGTTYRYFAIIKEEDYSKSNLKSVVRKYFDNSYLNVVSSLIKDENISVEEVRRLLDEVEKSHGAPKNNSKK